MKITCLFPIFKNDNVQDFFIKFTKSKFFKSHKDISILVYVQDSNSKAVEFFYEFSKDKPYLNILLTNKNFTYNDAFYNSLKVLDCDILLLGDTKIQNVDLVFTKCLEKQKQGANIVHVQRKQNKFKTFFTRMFRGLYNFFVKLYTSNIDKCNITSLGLIDKDILDILKTLPNKCCFLKNTPVFKGFTTKTIFIDDNVKTYKNNYAYFSSALKIVTLFSSIFFVTLTTLILGNVFLSGDKSVFNIITILTLVISLIIIVFMLPKHFFDIRNSSILQEKLVASKLEDKGNDR